VAQGEGVEQDATSDDIELFPAGVLVADHPVDELIDFLRTGGRGA